MRETKRGTATAVLAAALALLPVAANADSVERDGVDVHVEIPPASPGPTETPTGPEPTTGPEPSQPPTSPEPSSDPSETTAPGESPTSDDSGELPSTGVDGASFLLAIAVAAVAAGAVGLYARRRAAQ